jgi:KUP system potassium uptake protein
LAVARVPGTGIFMASSAMHVPPVLVHVVERTLTLHEQVVLFTVHTAMTPTVPAEQRFEVTPLDHGFRRVVAHFGFMETPNVPAILRAIDAASDSRLNAEKATYFLGREAILGHGTGILGRFAEGIYAFMQRNAVAADRAFQIPPKQVIEVGIQLDV